MGEQLIPPNIPLRLPGISSMRTDILSQWSSGKVAVYEGSDVQGWGEAVSDLASQLETRLELKVDAKHGIGFARANAGFPIEMIAYSPHAQEWAEQQPLWRGQHALWTDLFHGQSRDIC